MQKIKLEPIKTPEEVTVDDTKVDVTPNTVIDDDQECDSNLVFITVTRNNLG